MIQALTAYTLEADYAEDAVNEILEQLDLEHNLLKNSVGLITCYLDFIKGGVIEAICERLPFDVIGCTVPMSGIPKAGEQAQLSLMVLTSDSVEFSTGLSDPFSDQSGEAFDDLFSDLYHRASLGMSCKTELIIACQPFVLGFNWQAVSESLGRASGNIPVFGTLALDLELEVREPLVIYNGGYYAERMAVINVGGEIQSHFFAEAFTLGNAVAQDAIITEVDGVRLISINNMPAVQYIQRLGMVSNGRLQGGNMAIPIAVDRGDGTQPRVGTFYDITPDGAIICGEVLPVGASLAIGTVSHEDVLETAETVIDQMLAQNEKNLFLLFSCFSRAIVLHHPSAEMDLIQKKLDAAGVPYLFAYSGGEICPLYDRDGNFVNTSHIYSVVGAIL